MTTYGDRRNNIALTYFRVELHEFAECLVGDCIEPLNALLNNSNGFDAKGSYKYSLILNDWEYLDKHLGWSKV
jgi:hypothetical protein